LTDYLDLPLVTDPDALLETGVQYLEDALPGFQARPGNVETVLLEAASQIAAEVVEQAAQVDPVVFAYFGGSLVGLPIHEATSATGAAVITWAADTPAVLLDAGSQLALPHPSGEAVLFETDADVLAPAGGGDTTVGITAAEPGSAANGAFGEAELVNVTDGVQAITVAVATSGGVDEEDADAYLDRLADAFTILSPRPILPGDHATLVRQLPGVGRALAIDLMQPGTNDTTTTGQAGKASVVRDPHEGTPPAVTVTNQPRCTTVAITATGGAAPSPALMQQAWALLDASREVNFLNYVLGPTYTVVTVQATLHAWPGYSRADVADEAAAQLATWLGEQWDTSSASAASDWAVENTVRLSEAIDHLNRANSVHWVEQASVMLKAGTGAFTASDLVLPGLVPMPSSGMHALTVKLPGEA
jgi:uncharacterized phage protein gp47/JayE